MYDKAKVQAFIRTLSNEEISSQTSDLFAFMEEYKQLLLEEQRIRRLRYLNDNEQQSIQKKIPDVIRKQDNDDVLPENTLDFRVLNAIQSKVANFTIDELLENMKEIDEILSNGTLVMSPEAFNEYCAAREACDVRYYEEYQCEPIMCRTCGSYLIPNQKFCGKCGYGV